MPQFQANDAVLQFDIDKGQVDVAKITDAVCKLKKKLNFFLCYENICGSFLKHVHYTVAY
jgi:hypothetical protein